MLVSSLACVLPLARRSPDRPLVYSLARSLARSLPASAAYGCLSFATCDHLVVACCRLRPPVTFSCQLLPTAYCCLLRAVACCMLRAAACCLLPTTSWPLAARCCLQLAVAAACHLLFPTACCCLLSASCCCMLHAVACYCKVPASCRKLLASCFLPAAFLPLAGCC